MVLVGAGLREDLDTAIAEFVVLGGERILVDAYFADGGLGRKLAGGESINVNLATVGSRGGSSESLEISLQFIGVVRQGLQLLAGKDNGACIVGGTDLHSGAGLVSDVDVLLLDGDGKGHVE